MSGANGLPEEITLEELAKLIRILGMMGSGSDGEALNAARLAVRWVREKATDWETLLVPPAEAGVVSVTAAADPGEAEALADLAYRDGYQAGFKAAAAQVKAQASMASGGMAAGPSQWTSAFATMAASGPGSPVGGFGASAGSGPGPAAQGPVRGSGASGGPPGAPSGALWPPGTWQRVCQDLLDQHAQGIPGVLRSREESFVSDILQRGFATLTPAQEHWLRDIAGRNHMSW